MEHKDCKTCDYALTLYRAEKDGRFQTSYSPTGYVRCHGPRYKGRAYFCRDSKPGCSDYQRRERGSTT